MPKRKRNRRDFADEEDVDMEQPDFRVGMGSALGALKGVRSSDISHPNAADGDGGEDGWTKVGPSKKRKANNGSPKRVYEDGEMDAQPELIARQLKKDGYPSFRFSSSSKLDRQVRLGDLQNLVLYILAEAQAPTFLAVHKAKKIEKVVVLMVPGLDKKIFTSSQNGDVEMSSTASGIAAHPDDYFPYALQKPDLPDAVKGIAEVFPHLWPILSPGDIKASRLFSPLAEMLILGIASANREPRHTNYAQRRKGSQKDSRASSGHDRNIDADPVRLTKLVATRDQLEEDSYVLHPSLAEDEAETEKLLQHRQQSKRSAAEGWVDTPTDDVDMTEAEASADVTDLVDGRRILAMDCEMCKTSDSDYELTRISVVNYKGKVILDELVKPDKIITDYVTHYSGITKEILDPVETSLPDIQARLSKLLTPNTILIGHSVNSDFNALKMAHHSIVDTGMLYPHPRGPPFKSSLKYLAEKHLGRQIQTSSSGHNPIEDARAALDLVKLKAARGLSYGTPEAHSESIFTRLKRGVRRQGEGTRSLKSAVVDWGVPKRGYGGAATATIGCSNDDEVVAGIARAVNGDEDGGVVPGGGVSLTWARMRELEALRGWWNRSSTTDNDELRKQIRQQYQKQSNDDAAMTENDGGNDGYEATGADLDAAVSRTISRIKIVYDSIPPCTAFIVYSGNDDARELMKMQEMYRTHKKEFQYKKWDELSVRWTDVEEQAKNKAFKKARQSIAFATVK